MTRTRPVCSGAWSVETSTAATTADLQWNRFPDERRLLRGSALLSRLERHVGEDAFREALRAYLSAHAHGNATSDDLRDALDRVAPQPFAESFDLLLSNPLPALSPELRCAHGHAGLHVDHVEWPLAMCIAYDRDGKRAELCQRLGPGITDIDLPAKACPRWVLPDRDGGGLYSIDWGALPRDRVRAGWAQFTTAERRMIWDATYDIPQQIEIYSKLGIELPTIRDVVFLRIALAFVPEDLRDALDAIVLAKYGARARAAGLPRADRAPSIEDDIVGLALIARDPELVRRARELVASGARLPPYHDDDILVAAIDRPMLEHILDTVAWDRPGTASVTTLSRAPGLLDALTPERLARVPEDRRVDLLTTRCTPSVRARVAALYPPALATLDDCIERYKKLEPAFRAWLGHRS